MVGAEGDTGKAILADTARRVDELGGRGPDAVVMQLVHHYRAEQYAAGYYQQQPEYPIASGKPVRARSESLQPPRPRLHLETIVTGPWLYFGSIFEEDSKESLKNSDWRWWAGWEYLATQLQRQSECFRNSQSLLHKSYRNNTMSPTGP